MQHNIEAESERDEEEEIPEEEVEEGLHHFVEHGHVNVVAVQSENKNVLSFNAFKDQNVLLLRNETNILHSPGMPANHRDELGPGQENRYGRQMSFNIARGRTLKKYMSFSTFLEFKYSLVIFSTFSRFSVL